MTLSRMDKPRWEKVGVGHDRTDSPRGNNSNKFQHNNNKQEITAHYTHAWFCCEKYSKRFSLKIVCVCARKVGSGVVPVVVVLVVDLVAVLCPYDSLVCLFRVLIWCNFVWCSTAVFSFSLSLSLSLLLCSPLVDAAVLDFPLDFHRTFSPVDSL